MTSTLLTTSMRSAAAADCEGTAAWRTALLSFEPSAARPALAPPGPTVVCDRLTEPAAQAASGRLVARLGARRPGLVLGHVVLGCRLQQRAHLFLHGRDPVGHLHPLGAVPLLHVGGLMAVMIGAGKAG